jgi:hypothetical protein
LGKWFATKKKILMLHVEGWWNHCSAIHHTDLKSVDEIMETLNDIIPRAEPLNYEVQN